MTFSPLITKSVSTKNYSSRNGRTVTRLIVHYTAGGTDASNLELLSRSEKFGRQVSATYLLQRTGALVGIVPEEYRPWTSGGFDADASSITVEVVMAADGEATAAQMDMLARLAADLCERYGWGNASSLNVRGHREFAATLCPGPYLWPRLPQIISQANTLKPFTPEVSSVDLDHLARAVISGRYGNGLERKTALGSRYEAVQRRVNELLSQR